MGQVSRAMEVIKDDQPKPSLGMLSIDQIIDRSNEEKIERNVPYFKPDTEQDRSFGKLGNILKSLVKK